MQSSNAGETSRTTLGIPVLSEALEGTTPSSQFHTSNTAFSNPDQFDQFPKRVRSPRRVRSAPILVVQTSDNISASNSEDNRDPGQDIDNPLPNREDANAVKPGHTAEHYVPWLVDGRGYLGLIPMLLVLFAVSALGTGIWLTVFFLIKTGGSDWLIRRWNWTVYMGIVIFKDLSFPFILWAPIIGGHQLLLRGYPEPNNSKFRIFVVVVAVCLFGFLSWAYCALVATEEQDTVGVILRTWSTGLMPQSFRGCDARIKPKQAPLFETDIYYTQFARVIDSIYNESAPGRYKDDQSYSIFDMEQFRSIQINQTLCDQGFEGNNDLYGSGIRISLYLQWLSSFLANNFLPGTRQELQKPYLIFSMAICLVTIITSFAKACFFSIEIEIMYWMYWGGYVCVFASAPCQVRLGSEMKWIKLDWTTVILFTTHALMIYHGVWFVWYAYDQVFARMPCGTYHFFFFPILDPSQGFWTLRDYLTHLIFPLLPGLLAIFTYVGLLLASEVKYTIQHSTIYQRFFPKSTVLDRDQTQTSLGLRVYLFITRPYRAFREILCLPSHSRGGIRLVTPIDIRDRRLYRIRWAAMGLSSYILSIVAIEVILRWNKVSGVHSIVSTGQYVALIIGAGSFVSVSWTLVLQECDRRRNLKRRQVANQDENGIELDSLSHNLRDAISHAFSRADVGFSTNGGAFPTTTGEEEEEAVQSLNTPRPSPNMEVFMSGALDVQPDLEAQTPPPDSLGYVMTNISH